MASCGYACTVLKWGRCNGKCTKGKGHVTKGHDCGNH